MEGFVLFVTHLGEKTSFFFFLLISNEIFCCMCLFGIIPVFSLIILTSGPFRYFGAVKKWGAWFGDHEYILDEHPYIHFWVTFRSLLGLI